MKPEKGTISGLQMALMLYPAVIATAFLTLPTITAQYAGNDLWLTPILSGISGALTLFLAVRLHRLYPGQTVIEYSVKIVGIVPGKIIGFAYFVFLLYITGLVARQYAEFVKSAIMFKTPTLIVLSSILLLAAIAVRGGVELIARAATILTPIFIVPSFVLLLLLPDLNVQHLFPVLEKGWIPVLKGSLAPNAYTSEFFLMTFFLPLLSNPEKGAKWAAVSIGADLFTGLYASLLVLLLLGPDTADKVYPVLTAFRYISLASFFENLEALLMAMWVIGNFVKLSVFLYAAATSFVQTMELKNYRIVVYPLAVWCVLFSLWDVPDLPSLGNHIKYTSSFELLGFFNAIPLLLLLVAFARQVLGAGPNPPAKGRNAIE